MSQELKNGVCERHFTKDQITRGKKCRLQRDVIPTINLFHSSASKVIYLSEGSPIKSSISETKLFRTKATQTISDNDFVAEHNIVLSEKDMKPSSDKQCILCSSDDHKKYLKVIGCSSHIIDLLVATLVIKQKDRAEALDRCLCMICLDLLSDISSLQVLLETKLSKLKSIAKTNSWLPKRPSTQYSVFDSPIKQEDSFVPSCTTCLQVLPSGEDLMIHSIQHKTNNDCPVCGRFLTTRRRLYSHMFKFHGIGQPKESSYKCELCSKSFTTGAGLRYHMTTHHNTDVRYTCKVCKKNYTSRLLYQSHMTYMHGKKNISCKICGKRFFTGAKLNSHVNAVHRSAYTWSCKMCSDKFTTSTSYRHHIKTRHEKMSYKCKHCSSSFRKKSILMLHMHRHELFLCSFCDSEFRDPNSLSAHIARVHPKNKLDMKLNSAKTDSVQLEVDGIQHSITDVALSESFSNELIQATEQTSSLENLETLSFVEPFGTNETLAITGDLDVEPGSPAYSHGTIQNANCFPGEVSGPQNWRNIPLNSEEPLIDTLNADEISLASQTAVLNAETQFSDPSSIMGDLSQANVSSFILDPEEKESVSFTVYADQADANLA